MLEDSNSLGTGELLRCLGRTTATSIIDKTRNRT